MSLQRSLNGRIISPKEGYIFDFVTNKEIKATPEELDAIQPFQKKLVKELNYSKKLIQTRPQYYIKKGTQKIGPVDIAVFETPKKTPDNLYIIVECKSKTRKDGKEQLKSYMNPSPAVIGVWFNGLEHLYLRKVIKKDYKISYEEIPNLPRKGERIEDIGKYKRKDLIKPRNLTLIFKDIRNHLAGTLIGITRDETIATQIINLLVCKIYDEMNKNPNEQISFRVGIGEDSNDVRKRIESLFYNVRSEYSNIFDPNDKIEIDNKALKYIVGALQNYSLTEANRDAIRKAFEVFIGPALRGSEGQFFTPRNVVTTCVKILNPNPGDKIIDPACGSGGFLVIALTYIWEELQNERLEKKWSQRLFYEKWNNILLKCFKGIDKDRFLTKVTRAYMAILGNGKENIFCENSLELPTNWKDATKVSIKLNSFDFLLTNPPFGSKIKIKNKTILSQYDLSHKWKTTDGIIEKTNKIKKNRPPQILFIERCLQFLKKGGKMAIVLPEGILGNPTQEYIRKYIMNNAKILAVIDAPIETFLPNTSTKTCILFLQKEPTNKDYNIFMAIADKCGHDSRDNIIYKMNNKGEILYDENGNKIIDDDFPIITNKYKEIKDKYISKYDKNGFLIPVSKLRSRSLIPRFYDPTIKKDLKKLESNYNLVTIQELIDQGLISIFSGQGVKKKYYGTGDIPYIRTSDITNWELKIDPTHSVSEEIYEKFKQDLKINDILFVQDGGRLIGKTCMLSEKRDIKSLIQSHFQIIRIEDYKKLNPFLFFYLLNTSIVQKQINANIVIQSTIATIGDRIKDIILPIPKSNELEEIIVNKVKGIIKQRAILRKKIEAISSEYLEDII